MSPDVRDARGSSEDGFHEIQLSGKQLVFLFMATTVVSIVIFLCGVLVGRGVRPETTLGASAAFPADATAAQAAPVDDAAPVADDVVPPEPTTVAPGELSYHERLSGADTPQERVAAETTQAPREAPAPAPARAAAPPPEPAADPPARTAPAPPTSSDEGCAVQVTALREKKDAEAIARRLASRGYEAYVLDAEPGQAPLYRVRVGSFADRADAERVLRRLEQEEKFKPWITRTR